MNNLKESLYRLSIDYNKLKTHYPPFVDIVDEVVCDFEESFKNLPDIMERNKISQEAIIEILRCKNLIELLFTLDDKLSDESYENSSEWKQVRLYAKKAFDLLEF